MNLLTFICLLFWYILLSFTWKVIKHLSVILFIWNIGIWTWTTWDFLNSIISVGSGNIYFTSFHHLPVAICPATNIDSIFNRYIQIYFIHIHFTNTFIHPFCELKIVTQQNIKIDAVKTFFRLTGYQKTPIRLSRAYIKSK